MAMGSILIPFRNPVVATIEQSTAGIQMAKTLILLGWVDVPVHVTGPLSRTVWLTFRRVKGKYDSSSTDPEMPADSSHIDR